MSWQVHHKLYNINHLKKVMPMSDETILSRKELLSCMELGKTLTSELDPDNLFKTILNKLSSLIPADTWSLLLFDRSTGELSFKLSSDLDMEKVKYLRLRLGEGIAGQVALQQKPMVIPDVTKYEFFVDVVDQMSGTVTKSVMCVPLIFAGETVGVIEAINPYSLKKKSVSLLMLISDYAAIAVGNTRRYHNIQTLAIHDNLTGLYNTRFLYSSLADIIKSSEAAKEKFSLIFMDLDNFKNVVDNYGHLNGSKAIQQVAKTIKNFLKEPEFGVSYAGDEFVIVLPGYDKKRSIKKAKEIKTGMNNTVYLESEGLNIKLTASFGIATYPDDAQDRSELLSLADRAMFNIKDKGKNAVG